MSKLEEKFIEAWSKYGLGRIPERQYRFLLNRRYRFDFAWPLSKVAVEIDGFGLGHAIQMRKAHHPGAAIEQLSNSNERQNLAVENGWTVLRYTARQLGSEDKREAACKQILTVIGSRLKTTTKQES